MKNVALCVVLLLALPAFAQIVDVQNNSNFACSGMGSTVTCQVHLGAATAHQNLLAVWTYWQSASAYTASVVDSPGTNTFVSAVGPTLQSVSSPPINAQIFYAKNIRPSSLPDVVTITFATSASGTPSVSGGAVAVEYSGLDQVNPLDSVSAASSQSAGLLLDSGFAALSSTTIVAFGGGLTDSNYTPTLGSGFTLIQHTSGTASPGVLTEEYIPSNSATTPPSTLPVQAATEGYSGSLTAGNWIMQMAAFRAATSTVYAGWSPTRLPQYINAGQYPGPDICAQAQNAAIANPNANILVPVNGTQVCSVDPTGGWQATAVSSKPAFQGNMDFYPVGPGGRGEVDVDTPWLAGNSKTVAINFHGTNITTSNKFRLNVSGNRCWTNGSTDGSGNYTTCENPLTTVTVTPQTGTAAGCALVTMSMTSNTAYQIRGGEYVDMFYFSSLGNNGKFRVLAGCPAPCGSFARGGRC